MTKCILFNAGGIRVCELYVPDDIRIVKFGGAYFARTGSEAKLYDGGWGACFDESIIQVADEKAGLPMRKPA